MRNDAVERPKKITYETLWKAIIRPPREDYDEEELGSPIFKIEDRHYFRKDFELLNFQGYLIKVSIVEPVDNERPQEIMPCVIYLHANASSRIEGILVRRFLLKRDINLCVFDFQGSGLSEGDYISLGYHEKYQVKNIVDFLEKYPGVGEIGLWGRSMGAATSLIYASMDKRIKAVVADSPFEDFRKLAKEMVLSQIKVPGFLVEGAISIIGKSVKSRNGMDINDIKAIESVKNSEVPIIFIHATDDELVPYHHSEDLIKNYKGKIKELQNVTGGHNGRRPVALMEHVGDFFAVYLKSSFKPVDFGRSKTFVAKLLVKKTIVKEEEKKDNSKDNTKEKEKENEEDESEEDEENDYDEDEKEDEEKDEKKMKKKGKSK
jgi:pimeloyl-ACP methyl ester carboxylesterase